MDYIIVKKEIYDGTSLEEKRFYIKRRFAYFFFRYLTEYDHKTEKQQPVWFPNFTAATNYIREDRTRRKSFRTETTLLDEVGRPLK